MPHPWINGWRPRAGWWLPPVSQLCRAFPQPPDVYVISPFRMPAARLRQMLFQSPGVLPGRSRTDRRDWIEHRVGTVHTFQGKEAEAVILMLGAGRGAKAGSRNWAGATPNLLNVAATRAKRVLYVVGNRTEWQSRRRVRGRRGDAGAPAGARVAWSGHNGTGAVGAVAPSRSIDLV